MNYETAKSVIKESGDLQGLDEQGRATLFWVAEPVTLDQEAVLYKRGQPFDNTFYLLIAGSLEAVVQGNDPSIMRPGAIVGEVAYHTTTLERSATVRASDQNTQLLRCVFSREELKRRFPRLYEDLGILSWERFVADQS